MSHIDAEFSVFSDDETFELVARQGDAAGVIGVSTPQHVDIELDAADPTQVTAVRLWHDGRLTTEQLSVLETLLGDQAGHIASFFGASRPQRTGLRSRNVSSRGGDVSAELTLYVSALDALTRAETDPALHPLLALAANVANAEGRLGLVVPALPDPDTLGYALLGATPSARGLLNRLVSDAVELGVLGDPTSLRLFASLADSANPPLVSASELLDVSFSAAEPLPQLLSRAAAASSAEPLVLHPAAVLDPASVPCSGVALSWVHPANLHVRVSNAPQGVTLWARARRDADGTIVAAGPLAPANGALEAMLLVAELDHVVVDIVSSIDAPVLSHAAGSLARAYQHGRRAARLERLDRPGEAELAWRECARHHALAGDPQREKLALSRRFARRAPSPATVVDHLL